MKQIFLIDHDAFGFGSEERGRKGMGVFFLKLWAKDTKPDAIIFLNSAVKMAVKGSPHLPGLSGLVETGVDLIICQESLKTYKIEETLFIGRIADMDEISELIMKTEEIITL